jgi:hypothetical protein
MTEKQKQLLIKYGNAMVNYLTPEELEKYSEAEQAGKEAHEAKVKLMEEAKARNISGWKDALSPEEEEIFKEMGDPELEEAARVMDAEELAQFGELLEREGQAALVQGELFEIAAQRM